MSGVLHAWRARACALVARRAFRCGRVSFGRALGAWACVEGAPRPERLVLAGYRPARQSSSTTAAQRMALEVSNSGSVISAEPSALSEMARTTA